MGLTGTVKGKVTDSYVYRYLSYRRRDRRGFINLGEFAEEYVQKLKRAKKKKREV
jgi:hypothetical protein